MVTTTTLNCATAVGSGNKPEAYDRCRTLQRTSLSTMDFVAAGVWACQQTSPGAYPTTTNPSATASTAAVT
jgi:hypothetical protein